MTTRAPVGSLSKIFRILLNGVYRPQITLEFPADVIERERQGLRPLVGYEVHQPPRPEDLEVIASLLQQEKGFGTWTAARVRNELLSNLAHPMSAMVVLHNGVPAATGFATDASTRRTRIAHGMYLLVAPAYRGRPQLATYVIFATLGYCVDAGYQRILAFTDTSRLPALLVYLSLGIQPVYDSVSSFWKWRRVQRRLAPALRRLEQRRVARSNKAAAGTGAAS